MTRKRLLLMAMFCLAMITWLKENSLLNVTSDLNALGNIIFGSIFYTIFSIFTTIGPFLIFFFVAKAVFYYGINHPSKNIAFFDLLIFGFTYGFTYGMQNYTSSFDNVGWRMSYLSIFIWIFRIKYRKGLAL